MASSGATSGNFSGRTNFDLAMYVYLAGTSGNSSYWYWELHARQLSGSDSYNLNENGWSAYVNGQGFGGTHTLDFRGATNDILLGSGYTGWIAHDSSGNLLVSFSASMSAATFGSASLSGGFWADRIPQVPSAPPAPVLVSKTATTFSAQIYYSADNGGSGIVGLVAQLATDPGFTNIIVSRATSAGTEAMTGLTPATAYYFRYVNYNYVGYSPVSPTLVVNMGVAVPTAPLTPSATNLAPTGLTLNWTAPSNTGGAAVTGYRVTRALNSAFTVGVVQFTQGASLSMAFTDLLPSTTYYFKIAATNSAGYGPDSAVLTVTTVSGVSYSTGTSWQAAGIFVSNGTDWLPAEILVSDGTNWVAAI